MGRSSVPFLVAPCIGTGLFWLFLLQQTPAHRGPYRARHTSGLRQRQALHSAMPQTARVAIQQHRGKHCSVSTTASTDRRMVTWLLWRERFQMPFQPPCRRYAQKRWVYAFQRENVRAVRHARRVVYGSYFWKMEHSDFQLPSRHACKGTHFFPICFRRMFLHMGNFWIEHKPLSPSLSSWSKCKNACWNFKSASKPYNVNVLEPLRKPKLLRSGY